MDNSSLTGESEPQSRSPQCTDENPMETKNLAFFSTNALEGTAKGLVVAVGDSTFIGRIAGLASGLDSLETPMSKEVSHFVEWISAMAVFFGVTFFIVALCMGYDFLDAAIFLIGVIVANVPEGLLVTFTVVLALTAKRMAKKNCLVKQLHAVETLGSCSVICSDKTGTLTQNKMTVSHFWFSDGIWGAGQGQGENVEFSMGDNGFLKLSRVAALCLRAKFLGGEENVKLEERKINGDASESAILRSMERLIGNVEGFQEKRKKVFEIPFNSSNKWQLSVHETEGVDGDDRLLVVMKGAPERVVGLCGDICVGDEIFEMGDEWRGKFNEVYETLGGMGERVIGFCEKRLDGKRYPKGFQFDPDNLEFLRGKGGDGGMTFVGLVSMIDPPRVGVREAVSTCRTAGIKVVMVTGDHPITAKAIAKNVNIISEGKTEFFIIIFEGWQNPGVFLGMGFSGFFGCGF